MPDPLEQITITLTRAEAEAIVSSIDHGDVAYGQSWRELVSRDEIDARQRGIAKLEEALVDIEQATHEERRMIWREQVLQRERASLIRRLLGHEPRVRPARRVPVEVRRDGDPRWVLTLITDDDGWVQADLEPGTYSVSALGNVYRYDVTMGRNDG